MENKHVYTLVGIFAVLVVAVYVFVAPNLRDTTVAGVEMHEIMVYGPEGTAVKFNGIGTGYINRGGTLTKNLPVGTYTLECVGVSSQTVVVRQDIAVYC